MEGEEGSQGLGVTYKIVAVFEIAGDGNLAGSVAVGLPLAPVVGIEGPWRKVIARAGLHVGNLILEGARRTVRHGRVSSRSDVGEA